MARRVFETRNSFGALSSAFLVGGEGRNVPLVLRRCPFDISQEAHEVFKHAQRRQFFIKHFLHVFEAIDEAGELLKLFCV